MSRATTRADEDSIVEQIRAHPRAFVILERLAGDSDLEVRGWVPGAARRILGRDAIPLLMRLFRDRDPDIRGMALDALEELDPALLEPLLSELRKRLRSKDRDEVISIAWRLAARGDLPSIPFIEAFRDRHERRLGDHKVASVILLLMVSPDEIAKTIDSHDHDRMLWLPHAAILSGKPEAIEAVKRCADAAPDELCRRYCRYSLDKFAPSETRP